MGETQALDLIGFSISQKDPELWRNSTDKDTRAHRACPAPMHKSSTRVCAPICCVSITSWPLALAVTGVVAYCHLSDGRGSDRRRRPAHRVQDVPVQQPVYLGCDACPARHGVLPVRADWKYERLRRRRRRSGSSRRLMGLSLGMDFPGLTQETRSPTCFSSRRRLLAA